jgi:hypothetical protein
MNLTRNIRQARAFLQVAAFAAALAACLPEHEILDPDYPGGLVFSTDTLRFDTLFTSVGSTTKRLKVFNPNERALNISRIALGQGDYSAYSITVNGSSGTEARDVRLMGGDSLLILVNVFIDPGDSDLPFLVNDSLTFETNSVRQDVKLIAWGQDAVFLGNEVLDCDAVWTDGRPYVLHGSVLVDSLCTLEIKPGARIYGAPKSYLFVKGTLKVQGTADRRVLFRNDRLEPRYENAPGQWGGLIFLEGTRESIIEYAVIRNAEYGVRLGAPDGDSIPELVLRNTIIENMSLSGILSFTSDLRAENTLVNNCADFAAGSFGGGNYGFYHCTFANYGQLFLRDEPVFGASNYIVLANDSVIRAALNIEIVNSIIDGNLRDELVIDGSGGDPVDLLVAHSILKTTQAELAVNNNLLNVNPRFADPFRYNYRLDTLSPAMDKGLLTEISGDLDGNARDSLPDIGAYERIEPTP